VTSPPGPAGPPAGLESFGVAVTKADGEAVIAVRGEIDLGTAPLLWEAILDVLPDTKRLVVDLGHTDFIDSTGLGVLVRALKRLRHHGGDLVLRAPKANARKTLAITGLDRVITILD
jgi:anti-sigma B factor antagonist